MRHNQIRDLVLASILAALIIVMVITGIGYIQIGTIAFITILTVPVMVGALILGKWYGLALGVVFGLTSMIYSFVNPAGGINVPFTNPLLSVLPRALLGFIVEPIFLLFSKKIKKDVFAVVLTVVCCQIIHSLLVLSLLFVFAKTGFFFFAKDYPYIINSNYIAFLVTGFGLNGIIEIIFACLITTPVYAALKKVVDHKRVRYTKNIE